MFEMNFFVTFLFVSMLIITSLGIEFEKKEDMEKECSYNKTRYLITARSGMKFYKEEGFNGLVDVTYDCSLEDSYENTIELRDKAHPRKIDLLLIKNCVNFTVILDECENDIESLQITGGKEVTIVTNYEPCQPAEIVITDVKMLKWSRSHSYVPEKRNISLIFKNLVLTDFSYNSFNSLYMTGVTVESFNVPEISGSLLNITDSNIKTFKIFGKVAQAYIVNNTFEQVSNHWFYLHANESFVFSDNHVKKILGSFRVTSPKVEIVGNAFDYGEDTFFTIELLGQNFDENTLVSLNVSSNIVKSFHNNLVELTKSSLPDVITIERNQFNCYCKTSLYLEKLVNSSSESITTKLLLDAYMNNTCLNFGNCPLRKLLGKDVNVCSNTFVCPKYSSESTSFSKDKNQ